MIYAKSYSIFSDWFQLCAMLFCHIVGPNLLDVLLVDHEVAEEIIPIPVVLHLTHQGI